MHASSGRLKKRIPKFFDFFQLEIYQIVFVLPFDDLKVNLKK